MKRSQLLNDALREIKNTRSRFISLMVLSALAVCFLAGLRATAPDMKHTADLYFDQQKLMDLRIVSTLGLTQEDADALAARPEVTQVERAYTVDAMLHMEETDRVVKVLSYAQDSGINLPRLVEGRMPENSGECLAEPLLLQISGLQLGDVIHLDTGTGTFEDALVRTDFTIVGTADSPLYVGVERGSSTLGTGKVSAFLLLPMDSFQMDYYTDIYLRMEGLEELNCYSDAYTGAVEKIVDDMEPFADQRARLRGDDIREEANEKLSDAEAELADAEAEAEQELADAWAELEDGRKELDDGWQDYRDGQEELDKQIRDANREIADARRDLADALVKLNDGEQELVDARAELDDGWQDYYEGLAELEDGKQKYQDGLAEYEEGRLEFEDGKKKYEDGLKEYEDGLAEYYSGQADISDGWAQLAEAEAKLAQGETVLAGLNAQRDDLQSKLSEAQAQLAYLQGLLGSLPPDAPEYGGVLAGIAQAEAGISGLTGGIAQVEAGIAQAEAELSSGRAQIDAGSAELMAGEEELSAAWRQLRDAKKELDDAKAELDDAEAELADGWAELEEARLEIEDGQAELDDALVKLNDGEQELVDGRAELDDGWRDYNDGLVELEDAKRTLKREEADARQELADALVELEDGEREYADGLQEYEDGKAEAEEKIADARKELEQARRDVEELEDCEWYVLDRDTNMGYVSYSMDADRMGNLASVFPLIFFLVAALVCLTTMTRMVEEQRIAIGGMKALGYSKGAIAVKYVGYGFLASAIGSLIGLAVGLSLLPWIICNAWNIIYTLGPVQYGLEPVTSALACIAAVGTVTLAALGACFSALTAVPAQLMRPKAPPMGKRILLERITPLWRRLSFNYKVSLRNLFRYQKRFWMTVIGIGGCAALIVTAFGLRGSIFDVMDKQYDEIYRYTVQVGLVNKVTPGELREVARALDGSSLVRRWTACRSESVTAQSDAYTVDCTLQTTPDQAALEQFVDLRHRTDGQPVVLPDDGVVLTEKLASLLDVRAGDTFVLDADKRVEVRVADVTEHYIQHWIYMTDAYYTSLFGAAPADNLILADYDAEAPGAEELERELVALDGVTSLTRIVDTRNTFTSSLQSVDYAVVLIIVCAAALAFVVLYNLTNINITERMRELATLKVLGFYDGELSAYVYRENVFLTIFGVLMGLVMGKFLHQWLILTVEIDLLMFGRTLHPSCYGYAVVLTVIFSLLVNLSAHRKLKKLDMVESLKSVE